jgi:hypothetical protein
MTTANALHSRIRRGTASEGSRTKSAPMTAPVRSPPPWAKLSKVSHPMIVQTTRIPAVRRIQGSATNASQPPSTRQRSANVMPTIPKAAPEAPAAPGASWHRRLVAHAPIPVTRYAITKRRLPSARSTAEHQPTMQYVFQRMCIQPMCKNIGVTNRQYSPAHTWLRSRAPNRTRLTTLVDPPCVSTKRKTSTLIAQMEKVAGALPTRSRSGSRLWGAGGSKGGPAGAGGASSSGMSGRYHPYVEPTQRLVHTVSTCFRSV